MLESLGQSPPTTPSSPVCGWDLESDPWLFSNMESTYHYYHPAWLLTDDRVGVAVIAGTANTVFEPDVTAMNGLASPLIPDPDPTLVLTVVNRRVSAGRGVQEIPIRVEGCDRCSREECRFPYGASRFPQGNRWGTGTLLDQGSRPRHRRSLCLCKIPGLGKTKVLSMLAGLFGWEAAVGFVGARNPDCLGAVSPDAGWTGPVAADVESGRNWEDRRGCRRRRVVGESGSSHNRLLTLVSAGSPVSVVGSPPVRAGRHVVCWCRRGFTAAGGIRGRDRGRERRRRKLDQVEVAWKG